MIKHVTERETALEAELHALKREDRRIRRLLCAAVADRPYMDDGEASDNEIDYLRESAVAIESKLYQRNLKKFRLDAAGYTDAVSDGGLDPRNTITDWSAA